MNIVNAGYDSTNYYVLDVKAGKLLIDCGWPGTLPRLRAALKRKGIGIEEISYLLVTHFHPDHAGIAQEIKDAGAQLLLLESQPEFISPMEELFRRKRIGYTPVKAERNIRLSFEQSRGFLDGIGIKGEILLTPGHTDDSVTLILDEGLAFTGDLSPLSALAEDDEVSRMSWERIHEHKVSRVFPAHGG